MEGVVVSRIQWSDVALYNNLPVYSEHIASGPQHAGAEAAKAEALRRQLRRLGKDDDSSSR
jgi:hypothetical protein